MSAPADETKAPTLPGVLMLLAGLVFKREALLVITSSVVLLAAGGLSLIHI